MMVARVLVVMRRVLAQLARDRRTIAMIVIQPIVIMGVFGYAFGGEISGARVAVADLDRGTLGEKVLDKLNHTTVDVVRAGSGADAEAAVHSGSVALAVVFPANFTRNFESTASGDPRSIVLETYQDNSNPQVTGPAIRAFSQAVSDAIENETGKRPSFLIDEHVVFGSKDPRALEFFVPGIAAFAIFQLGSLLTVITIVKERTLGTLPRVLASPIRRWEVVVGYTSAFTLLSILQACSILTVATLLFRVPIRGSVLVALVATTLVGLTALGFGILVSGLARSEFQAVQSVFLFSFPMLFLSGVFAPIESMPALLRPLVRAVPLSYAVHALRETLNHGRALGDIAPDLAVLVAFAALFLGLATLTFGRKA